MKGDSVPEAWVSQVSVKCVWLEGVMAAVYGIENMYFLNECNC